MDFIDSQNRLPEWSVEALEYVPETKGDLEQSLINDSFEITFIEPEEIDYSSLCLPLEELKMELEDLS